MDRYRHSGIVPPLALTLFVPIAAAAAILGVLYTFLIAYIPYVYANFAITIAFGAALGMAVGWAARVGKIRNTFAVVFLAFVVAAVGYYVSWAFDPLARFGPDMGTGTFQLSELWPYVQESYTEGTWGIVGWDIVRGKWLGAIWGLEALIIFGGATVLAAQKISGHPFCERCDGWMEIEEDVRRFSLADVDSVTLEEIEEGRLDVLEKLQPIDGGEDEYLRIDLACCAICAEVTLLTVQRVTQDTNDEGKVETTAEPLVQNLIVDESQVLRFRLAGHQGAGALIGSPRGTGEGEELYPEEAMPVA